MSSAIDDISNTDPKVCDELYEKARDYWLRVQRDDDGMLGGFQELHKPDIRGSLNFLDKLFQKKWLTSKEYALDAGAGIGRVTKGLLMPIFEKVDMVDMVAELVQEKSKEYIGENKKVVERFAEGLQTFQPPFRRYDLIWVQWVTGHLPDEDFRQFFERCKLGLRPGGVICLKENVLKPRYESVFDYTDHSWTRSESRIEELLIDAGLDILSTSTQRGFPKGMYKDSLDHLDVAGEDVCNEAEFKSLNAWSIMKDSLTGNKEYVLRLSRL